VVSCFCAVQLLTHVQLNQQDVTVYRVVSTDPSTEFEEVIPGQGKSFPHNYALAGAY
jgi:hypothetical protein